MMLAKRFKRKGKVKASKLAAVALSASLTLGLAAPQAVFAAEQTEAADDGGGNARR